MPKLRNSSTGDRTRALSIESPVFYRELLRSTKSVCDCLHTSIIIIIIFIYSTIPKASFLMALYSIIIIKNS